MQLHCHQHCGSGGNAKRMRQACPDAPKDQVDPVVQVGGDKGPLQGSAVAAQEVVRAVAQGGSSTSPTAAPLCRVPSARPSRLTKKLVAHSHAPVSIHT